jgi:DNA-binding transcriptional LysR family regulator
VRAGAVDVGFTALPVPTGSGTLRAIPLGNVESVLVAHPQHPLAAEPAVSVEQLPVTRSPVELRPVDHLAGGTSWCLLQVLPWDDAVSSFRA